MLAQLSGTTTTHWLDSSALAAVLSVHFDTKEPCYVRLKDPGTGYCHEDLEFNEDILASVVRLQSKVKKAAIEETFWELYTGKA